MSEQEHAEFQQRAVHLLNAVFPEITSVTPVETWQTCERLLPHVMTCVATIPDHLQDQELAAVLLKTADYLYDRGQDEQAQRLYQRALHLFEQQLGPEHPQVGSSLYKLAWLYRARGKHEQSGLLFQRALRLLEQALGPEHPEVAFPLSGLALLRREMGKYEEAEALYQRALQIREQHWGQHHPETAQTLYDLALFRRQQGKLDEALSLAERALQIRSQSLGDAHPKTVASRTLLAQLGEASGTSQDGVSCPRGAEEHPDHVSTEHLWKEAVLTPQETSSGSPSENDSLQEFLTACCELHPLAWCPIRDLRHAYEHWTASCQGHIPLSRRTFAAQLKARGCRVDRTSTARIWRGIRLVKTSP